MWARCPTPPAEDQVLSHQVLSLTQVGTPRKNLPHDADFPSPPQSSRSTQSGPPDRSDSSIFSESQATTLMLHGVPTRRSLKELMTIFDKLGFAESIDFLYLPQRA